MMQLFTINRYDTEDNRPDEANEDKKLEKLLKKVEKRKRKLEKLKQDKPDADQEEESTEIKKVRQEIEPLTTQSSQIHKDEVEQTAPTENEPTDDPGKFPVLGIDVFEKKVEAKMVLPLWLREPTIIVNEIAADSADLKDYTDIISPVLLENLNSQGMTKFFPVQKQVIPWLLEAHSKPPPFRPRDICVSAPTGSGKHRIHSTQKRSF